MPTITSAQGNKCSGARQVEEHIEGGAGSSWAGELADFIEGRIDQSPEERKEDGAPERSFEAERAAKGGPTDEAEIGEVNAFAKDDGGEFGGLKCPSEGGLEPEDHAVGSAGISGGVGEDGAEEAGRNKEHAGPRTPLSD